MAVKREKIKFESVEQLLGAPLTFPVKILLQSYPGEKPYTGQCSKQRLFFPLKVSLL